MKKLAISIAIFFALSVPVILAVSGADYEIVKVSPAVIPTPEYQFSGGDRKTGRAGQWLEVEVTFMARPELTDELTFQYFILLGGKLFPGEVTHINIPKGRDLNSVMYVAPRTLLKLTGGKQLSSAVIEDVGVQITSKGQVVAFKSFKGVGQWWQKMPQEPAGSVLNKMSTPFAPLYWDRYEAIKPGAR